MLHHSDIICSPSVDTSIIQQWHLWDWIPNCLFSITLVSNLWIVSATFALPSSRVGVSIAVWSGGNVDYIIMCCRTRKCENSPLSKTNICTHLEQPCAVIYYVRKLYLCNEKNQTWNYTSRKKMTQFRDSPSGHILESASFSEQNCYSFEVSLMQ